MRWCSRWLGGRHSGFIKESGDVLRRNVVTGLARSVLQRTVGEIEDLLAPVTDSQQLYAEEYFQPGSMGTLADARNRCSWPC